MADSKELKQDLDRVETKIDKLDARQDRMELVLVQNTQILDEHQRRSLALESYVEQLEAKMHNDIKPVLDHVVTVKATMRVLMWIGSVIVAMAGILTALNELGVI
jgi:DNA repair exonuclease SbcCD ATPase subunit